MGFIFWYPKKSWVYFENLNIFRKYQYFFYIFLAKNIGTSLIISLTDKAPPFLAGKPSLLTEDDKMSEHNLLLANMLPEQ